MEQANEDFIELTERFIRMMGEPVYSEPVPQEIIDEYAGVIMGDDEYDVMAGFWKKFGFSGFRKGLFWVVNPNEYNPIARQFEELSDQVIVFARTATGNLFLWEWLESVGRPNIVHFNVHTRELTLKSNSLDSFLGFDVLLKSTWEEEFYGKMEYQAIEKFGPVKHDECIAYVPALALGGEEHISNMEPQKIIPHLMLLSQL